MLDDENFIREILFFNGVWENLILENFRLYGNSQTASSGVVGGVVSMHAKRYSQQFCQVRSASCTRAVVKANSNLAKTRCQRWRKRKNYPR